MVLLVCTVGCTRGTKPPTPVGTIRIALPMMPLTLTPTKMLDTYSFYVGRYFHETLFTFDNEFGFSSNILKTWSTSPDGRTYHFQLKDNLFFHDGSQVTPQDVTDSLRQCRSMKSCALAYIPGKLDILSVGPRTFDIRLDKPNTILLFTLSDRKSAIIPSKFTSSTSSDFERAPVGLGPFKITSRSSNEILLSRFDQYAGAQAKNSKIEFRLVTTIAELEVSHRAAPFHDVNPLASSIEQSVFQAFLAKNQFKKVEYPFLNTNVIFFSFLNPKLKNLSLRRFLFELFRKQELVSLVNPSGDAIQATGLIPQGMLGHLTQENLGMVAQPDLSELYKAVPGSETYNFRIISYLEDSKISQIRSFLQKQLDKYPRIKISLEGLPKKAFYQKVQQRDFDMALVMWIADYTHPYFYIELFHTGNEYNLGNISDSEIDTMLDSFSGKSKAEIESFCKRLDKRAIEKSLLVPISSSQGVYYFPANLKNFELSVLGNYMFDFSNTEENL